MAISKLILNGVVQMDVTSDTANTTNVLSGFTATKNDGTKITGSIPTKSAANLTASGSTVTVPSGYYSTQATKNISAGSAFPPAVTITKNPTITLTSSTGVITAAYSGSSSITPTVTPGYISQGTAGTVSTTGTSTFQLPMRNAASLTANGSTVTVPSGFYSSQVTKNIGAGTAATPNTPVDATLAFTLASWNGTVTVNASGGSYVTPTITPGYISTGTSGYFAINGTSSFSLPLQPTAIVTPGTTDQVISQYQWLNTSLTIKGDSKLVSSNIKSGVSIFGVNGTYVAPKTYTVKIHENSVGVNNYVYVEYKNTRYYTGGDTFEVAQGDSVTIGVFTRFDTGQYYISEYDEVLLSGTGSNVYTYTIKSDTTIYLDGSSYISNAFAEIYYLLIPSETPTITSNGHYSSAWSWYDVWVSVPTGITPTGTSIITSNGLYDVTNYASASVSVAGGVNIDEIALKRLTSASGSATHIGSYAFYCFSLLTNVDFPSCTYINQNAFFSCNSLTTINFPLCRVISGSAFMDCEKLTSAAFPSCTTIGYQAFYSCYKLASISFPKCSSMSSSAFYRCSSLTEVFFPSCSIAGYYAFASCSRLVSAHFSVLTNIQSRMFANCYSLTDVSIPLCTNIGTFAFTACRELKTVSFSSCISISGNAFTSCYNLLSAYFLTSVVPSCGPGIFTSTPIGDYTGSTGGVYGSIFVRESLYNSFITAANWSLYSARIVSLTDAQIAALDS